MGAVMTDDPKAKDEIILETGAEVGPTGDRAFELQGCEPRARELSPFPATREEAELQQRVIRKMFEELPAAKVTCVGCEQKRLELTSLRTQIQKAQSQLAERAETIRNLDVQLVKQEVEHCSEKKEAERRGALRAYTILMPHVKNNQDFWAEWEARGK